MRASKENAETQIRTVKRIQSGKSCDTTRLDNLLEFLEAAKRKLPSNAAYDRDRQRSRKK